jgi:Peptidase family C25
MIVRPRVRVLLCVTALAAYSASGAAAPPLRPLSATCRFDAPVLETDAAGVTRVSIADCVPWSRPGEPILPFRTLCLALPLGFTATGLVARASSPVVTLPGVWQLEIAQEPTSFSTPVSSAAVPSVTGAPYALAELASIQCLAGYNIAVIRVFPLQYTAATQRLDFTSDVTIEITLSPALYGLIAPSTSHVANQHLAAVVDNPEELSAVAPFLPADFAEPAEHYLLITRAALLPAFQPLVDQKTASGLTVHTETMEVITNQFAGVDSAERLRNFIRYAYTTWGVQYVLLGGDFKVVPTRGVYAYCSGVTETALPSDLYFACLDGSWNHDGDGLWGEPTDGETGGDVDLLAEVCVGRAPVENLAEVTNFVLKCLAALQTPSSRFRACFAGEYLYNGNAQGGNALDTLCPAFSNSFCPVTWLDDRPQLSAVWGASGALAALNSSPLLVAHFGHGTDRDQVDTQALRLSVADLDALTNETPFLLYSTACFTGAFDYSTTRDCMAEELVKRHTGGAFAVVANPREGWYDKYAEARYSGEYQKRFFDRLLATHQLPIGVAHQLAKHDLLGSIETSSLLSSKPYRWCMFGITLFGDPHASIQVPLSLRLSMTPSGRMITWNSWPAHTYAVYRATTLSADPGICLTNNMLATPPTNVFIDPEADLDRAFYRVFTPAIPEAN